jgi:hypothetical protein
LFPPNSNTPAFTVVPPVKVFTPLNTNVPLPAFVNETGEDPSAITPANVPPPNVNAVPPIVTNPPDPPLKPSNSTDPAASVTVPFAVKTVSTGKLAPPATVNVAPVATVTNADAKLAEPFNAKVPAFTPVAPVYVLEPVNDKVPAPDFTSDPADVPSAITPANVPPPTVNAVPFNVTNPVEDVPFTVNNSTAAGDNVTDPSAVNTVDAESPAPTATVNAAPDATFNTVDARLPVPVNASVPAFTLVAPLYVFAPLKLIVPELTFTNEPAVVPSRITPPNVPLLNVNAVPFNVTRPDEAPFNVNNSTPAADNPSVPSTVTAAVTGTAAPPATVNVASFATDTVVEANRADPVNANVPAFTLVDPVNVLTPLKLNVPAPTFTKDPTIPPSATTPANTPPFNVNAVPSNVTNPVDAPFNVSNSAANADIANVPSTVTAAPVANAASAPTLKVAPVATVNAVDANLPVPVSANVPAFTLVDPVNVFTPLKSNVPALTFTNDPAEAPSAITPANVPLLNVNAVPSNVTRPVDAPSNVNNVTADADNASVPSNVTAAVTGTIAPDATLIVAWSATVTAVDANRPFPLNANVPAFTAVAPVNVFTPLNVNVPPLFFTNDPELVPPAITPA